MDISFDEILKRNKPATKQRVSTIGKQNQIHGGYMGKRGLAERGKKKKHIIRKDEGGIKQFFYRKRKVTLRARPVCVRCNDKTNAPTGICRSCTRSNNIFQAKITERKRKEIQARKKR